jgi:hypothetical protein
VKAKFLGAMRCGHRVRTHPLARCGLAAAVPVVRGNTRSANANAGKRVTAKAAYIRRIIVAPVILPA